MLTVSHLTCTRGDRCLFADLAFTLEAGCWLHVSGENGAGKTSLLRLLCGISQPEAGDILWLGQPVHLLGDMYRREVLYLGHQNALKEELSAQENLRAATALTGMSLDEPQTKTLLQRAGLGGREDLPVGFLSRGLKQRAALARLLCSKETLWILDEPYAALDKPGVEWLSETLMHHLAQGGMLVLSSHLEPDLGAAKKHSLRLAA